MHSGVYSKSETPVNLTLTSSPVESLGRTIMVSLMFWGEKQQGRLAREAGQAPRVWQPKATGAPQDGGDQFWGWVTRGLAPHLLEVELQPLRGFPGLGGQDAIPCKAARSAPGTPVNRGTLPSQQRGRGTQGAHPNAPSAPRP